MVGSFSSCVSQRSGIGKYDTKDTASTGPVKVKQRRAIQFAQLARYIQPKPGAARARRKERLEDLVGGRLIHAQPAVQHFDIRSPLALHAASLNLDHDAAGFAGVLDRVVAEIPQHLAQMAAVHADLEVRGNLADSKLAFLQFERA